MTHHQTRREFIGSLLVACGAGASEVLAVGQSSPRDNCFQARLSHLYAGEGKELRQVLLVNAPGADAAATIDVQIGKRSYSFEVGKLRMIHGQYYLPVVPIEQVEIGEFALKAGSRRQETSLEVRPVRRWKIYMIHTSHTDLGYAGLPSKMRPRFVQFIDDASRICREADGYPDDAKFRWNIECSFTFEDYRRTRSRERTREIVDWVKKGRISLGGFYTEAETDFMSLETLHRFVQYSTINVPRELGIGTDFGMLDDVPGYTWSLVDVMAKSGLRYLIHGANGDRSNAPDDMPLIYYIAGPSGCEVLVFHTVVYYQDFDRDMKPSYLINDGEVKIAPYFDRYERGNYPFDTILMQVAQDFNPPWRDLPDAVKRWNELWAYPRLRLATPGEFFHYIEAQPNKDRIPRLRGGAPDSWVDTQAAVANAAALGRQAESMLPDVERLSTLAHLTAESPTRSEEFRKAYDELLLWEEHTFGLASNGDIYFDKSEGGAKQCWDEKRAHAEAANAAAGKIDADVLETLCRYISTRAPLSIVVWNPLSFKRSDIVRMPVPGDVSQPFRLVDVETGRETAIQIEKRKDTPDSVAFLAVDVPALGYRTYSIEPGSPVTAEAGAAITEESLENQFYKLTFDPKYGAVSSLFDKEVKHDYVDSKAAHGFNSVVYRLYKRLTDREVQLLGEFQMGDVQISHGASGAAYSSIRVSGNIENIAWFEHEIIMYSDLRRIDFYNRVKKTPMYAKESMLYAFPFAIPDSRQREIEMPLTGGHHNTYRIDVPGAILQPDVDQIPGSARDNYVVRHFVSISRPDYGVFWSTADAPLVQLGGIQSDKFLPRLTMQHEDWLYKGWLYSLVMQNHLMTNEPWAQEGDYLFRYAVSTHGPEWTWNDAHHFGWGFMSPLRAFVVEGARQGEWPESSRGFIEIEPENVYLAGFKVAEDGDGVILRLHEGAQLDTNATVRLRFPSRTVSAVIQCDAGEQNRGSLKSTSEVFQISLKPFETATVRVRLR
jgi:Glycosyl hydrolases family 38 N-terminal domain/Glycosyl hydrolases family 38 C-terminal beta sandwich domain/Glycosyl hydrolases family 38 C-terminal domain